VWERCASLSSSGPRGAIRFRHFATSVGVLSFSVQALAEIQLTEQKDKITLEVDNRW
jgi:hypothetical protein